MRHTLRAWIGLGANVGHAQATLEKAVRALAALPNVRVVGVSSLYCTRPVGVIDQRDFLNAVAAVEVPAGPDPETGALALLAALKHLEAALGRRPRAPWGPREVDLDLLLFGRHVVHAKRSAARWLEVPHPQMGERLFVLEPLAELRPRLRPPGWTETVAAARRRRLAVEGRDAVKRVGRWDAAGGRWTESVEPGTGRSVSAPAARRDPSHGPAAGRRADGHRRWSSD